MRACLLAGAVGDALGAAIEFDSLDEIRARHGADGLRDYAVAYGRRGSVTDDTQLTLFTLEGLIRARLRLRTKGIGHPPSVVLHAYLRWLHTQGVSWAQAGGPFAAGRPGPDGWLLTERALHSRRAPGNTCLSALIVFAAGGEQGSVACPPNSSKGCGGVMRAAPAGFWPADIRTVFELGCEVAALTHGHPSGYLPAGVLAVAVAALLTGADLPEALDAAVGELRGWDGAGETLDALDLARTLARRGRPTAEDLEGLGGGWIGEEALAIAVCVALSAEDIEDGLRLAVNHSGDSDSTGSICGNLLGARWGDGQLPVRWLDELEARQAIETLAADAAVEFGETPATTADGAVPDGWLQRYPPW